MNAKWIIRQTKDATRDRADIVRWTIRRFGTRQAHIYTETIALALEMLEAGPNIRALHVARQGRKGRHFIVYRVSGTHCIDVLRLLHDGMDLPSKVHED